jgi:hypothetical protein
MLSNDSITIKYYLYNRLFAERSRNFIPRVGELIRFKGIIYKIHTVVVIEDEGHPHIAIDIISE